jgi:hypothetical protein
MKNSMNSSELDEYYLEVGDEVFSAFALRNRGLRCYQLNVGSCEYLPTLN